MKQRGKNNWPPIPEVPAFAITFQTRFKFIKLLEIYIQTCSTENHAAQTLRMICLPE